MLITTHEDTVSGTTIMDDGTKIYWTESGQHILYPDGREESVYEQLDWVPALGDAPEREMTAAETLEHDLHVNRR